MIKEARRHKHVGAVVIGGGPAGVAVVGNLLEHLPKDAGNIVWIDKGGFQGGRLQFYQDVPR